MINPVGNTISALRAFQKKMDVTANNVANVTTDGFKKSRVNFSEDSSGGVTATIDKVNTPGVPKDRIQDGQNVEVESSNVDLAEELPELMTTTSGYKANIKTLHSQNEMLGSLLDIFG